MIDEKTVTEWKPIVAPVLDSKVNELILSGYSKATHDDVWACLVAKVWKDNPSKRLYKVTQEILRLRSNEYMNYLTVNAYKDDDLMASISALIDGN